MFRNPQFYFKNGISFSNTGIYSPTFRLSHGGVFDQKGSNIFCEFMDELLLLGILSSTCLKYFAKAFINHGVDAQLDDLPIAIPNVGEAEAIREKVGEIIAAQQQDSGYDYHATDDLPDRQIVGSRTLLVGMQHLTENCRPEARRQQRLLQPHGEAGDQAEHKRSENWWQDVDHRSGAPAVAAI